MNLCREDKDLQGGDLATKDERRTSLLTKFPVGQPTSSETADGATAVPAPGDNSKQSSEAKEEGLSEESKSQSVDETTTTYRHNWHRTRRP